jgi:hypothetical protein
MVLCCGGKTKRQDKVIPGLDTFAYLWRAILNIVIKEPNDIRVG